MTWRRGLIRLWSVGSAVWAVFAFGVFWTDRVEFRTLDAFLSVAALIVGVPLAVLLAGLIIAWVLRGFRR